MYCVFFLLALIFTGVVIQLNPNAGKDKNHMGKLWSIPRNGTELVQVQNNKKKSFKSNQKSIINKDIMQILCR